MSGPGRRPVGAGLRAALAGAALTVEQVVADGNQACDRVVVAWVSQSELRQFVDPGLEPSEQVLKPGDTVGRARAVVHLRRINVRPARAGVPTRLAHAGPPSGAGRAAIRTPGRCDATRPAGAAVELPPRSAMLDRLAHLRVRNVIAPESDRIHAGASVHMGDAVVAGEPLAELLAAEQRRE
jgi:hypothetical protein